MGEAKTIPEKIITESPAKAIRIKCLECNCSRGEVRNCGAESCALWPFRFGKNPFSTRGKNLSLESRQKLSAGVKARWAKEKK